MQRSKSNIDSISVWRATEMAIHWRDEAVKRAVNLLTDPKKEERLKSNQCIHCFYSEGRMACAAMTTKPCGICDKEMHFGSSCTDEVCGECAKENELCCHCGADIRLRPRRRFEKKGRK